jgi:hypothetical protein
MAEQKLNDRLVATVKQRLQDDLVDQNGQAAAPSEIESVVAAKAESFAEAPVQEFIPLRVEHQARDELRQQGLHRNLGDETDVAAPEHDLDTATDGCSGDGTVP